MRGHEVRVQNAVKFAGNGCDGFFAESDIVDEMAVLNVQMQPPAFFNAGDFLTQRQLIGRRNRWQYFQH